MSRLLPIARRFFLIAAPLALCLMLLFPAVASAHAILLRSDPAQDVKLSVAPRQVRMWFSEDLNPAFSTASVVNASNTDASNVNAPGHRVDNRDAHVSPGDPKEMDVTLQPNLPPAAYIVLYQTDSAVDGHILRGSFIFFVTRPDGTVPTVNGNSIAGINSLGNGNVSGLFTGQIDGPTLFNLVMITLVELGAVFWVGAQLWLVFVLQPVTEDHQEQRQTNQQVQQRFERLFALPTLLALLLANIGVLVGQALYINDVALTPALIIRLATSGRFGTFWMMREIVIGVALALALYTRAFLSPRQRPGTAPTLQRPHLVNKLLPWANLVLGLALFIAITMSSHAAAVSKSIVFYAIPLDWLHLLAAALWVGGMMYIATSYLPVLRQSPIAERARSLITVLPYFSPWALAGVALMAVTGPFSATFHLSSWGQFITTAYGRALVVKIVLVCALLATSAVHVGLLRPRLKKEYKKYTYAAGRLSSDATIAERKRATVGAQFTTPGVQQGAKDLKDAPQSFPLKGVIKNFNQLIQSPVGADLSRPSPIYRPPGNPVLPDEKVKVHNHATTVAQQVKLREGRLAKKTQRLMGVLRWEPLLGVAVLMCVGLMNVFAGTLSPTAAAQQQPTTTNAKPFHTTVKTTDKKFTVTFDVNPNRFGTNLFTVVVVDNTTGKPTTNVGVSLYTTMLDMDMGTDTINLLPDGKGHFSRSGDLSMGGTWQIRIAIRTLDNTLHEARVQFFVPF